ncbi:MAG TPA: AEC family transporter [Aminobacteriaceae bacterium]|nr:AEC family transporter [Synergistaceae bacterium]HRV98532.1 AEC family transporter [Aminobacteriaceae bacterium]
MNELLIIAPIAAVILLGRLLGTSGAVSPQTFRETNKILYWISIPALLLRLTVRANLDALGGWNLFFAVYGTYFLLPLIAFGIGRLFKEDRKRLAISALTSMRSNQVFMGIPAVSIAMGNPGLEALSLFLAMSLVGYHVISIASSQLVITRELSVRSLLGTISKVVRNPMVCACLVGILCSSLGFREFPGWIDTTLKVLGDIGTGLALLALGASIKVVSLKGVFRSTWRDCTIKLFLHPLTLFLFFSLLPVEKTMMQVVVFCSAMPVAVNSLVVAQGMGMDEHYAAELIAVSTMLSVFTLPLWIRFLGI